MEINAAFETSRYVDGPYSSDSQVRPVSPKREWEYERPLEARPRRIREPTENKMAPRLQKRIPYPNGDKIRGTRSRTVWCDGVWCPWISHGDDWERKSELWNDQILPIQTDFKKP